MAATKRQNEAITTHDKSMVVTAGAGSGKTYVLVQKYLNLLESTDVEVPDILALTFTDKAAAEMKERIRKELTLRTGPAWEKAAEDFMIAPVQTFHSFCAQVLREFPIEAGLEPGFIVLDERQASRIYATAFENLVHTPQAGTINEAVVRVLSLSDQKILRNILSAMYEKRLSYDKFFSAIREDKEQVVFTWMQEVHQFRNKEIHDLYLDRSFRSSLQTLLDLAERYEGADDKAAAFLGEIRPLLEQLSQASDTEQFCCAAAFLLTKKPGNVGSKKVWREEDLSSFKRSRKDLTDILDRKKALFRMTVDPGHPTIRASLDLLQDLSVVFSRYKELVEEEKGMLSGLDFGDLILNARRLFLEQPELVATHFMPRFRYILVDEFQDTDLTQFDIILSIIGEPTPGTDRLFIVGDPKQSIYLFRDADVTRFKEAQQIILDGCKGRVVNLDTSFRSTKEIIALTNILFLQLFGSAEKPWEFLYEKILGSEGRADHTGSVELMLVPHGEDTASSKRNEADMVARRIYSILHDRPLQVYEAGSDHAFVQRPARYGDIAILLEQRTNLSYYLASLNLYGIPFYVHGGTGFYSRQEVYDLYNLLRFLEYPHDDISLAGVLRSPYFGLPDTELFRIAGEPGRNLWNKLGKYAEQSTEIKNVHKLLLKWQDLAGRTGLVEIIRQILADSGIYTVYAALPEGKQILANVEKMIAMAREKEEAGQCSISEFTADLRTAMDEEEREGEAPLDAIAENAVNIMTVHAAKGLEFPIVFVPDMGMRFRERFPPIMIGDNPLLVGIKVPDPEEGYEMSDTPVLVALREMQRQKERAEKKRVLYVALTRARDHLIMSGTAPANPELSTDLASSRIEWIFSALGITGDAVTAGGMVLSSDDCSVRLSIVSDPESIPAERGKVKPELIIIPEECAGKNGTWSPERFEKCPEQIHVYTVSELEKLERENHPEVKSQIHSVESKYLDLPGIKGELKGTIIHEVLRGRDARVVCRENGVDDPEVVRQCEEIVANFRSTDLMKRVKREFCELPFVITFEGKRVKGQIDRLCELDDGTWVVIDYKSEAVAPEEYSLLAKEYELAMRVYVEAAREISSRRMIRGLLYFSENGIFHEIYELN